MSANKIQFHKLLSQAWLVLILAAFYGGGLAFIHITLSPRIAANIKNETYSLIPTLVGNPEQYEVTERDLVLQDRSALKVYEVKDGASKGVGWVIPASSMGFADKINLLVGIDYQFERITGMEVIDQKETPGLGNLIIDEEWRDQFKGKSTAQDIEVVKRPVDADQEVEAVTGATISSVTVAVAINETLAKARPEIERLLNESISKQP